MKNNQEYYFAYIGPTDRKVLDKKYTNGEGCLRKAIKETFYKVTGHYAEIFGSGWGVEEDQTYQISFSTYDEELKLSIVQSYLTEKKKMPKYIKAWFLLFKEEKKI